MLVLVLAVPTDSKDLCTGFGSGPTSFTSMHQEFKRAVVRVGDVGTAYLIDSENGYLLTAGHVVEGLAAEDNADPHIIMGESPFSEFSFKVIKPPTGVYETDVALLQLVPPDAMRNVRALDIAFAVPVYETRLFAMGYPHYDDSKVILRAGEAKFAGSSPGGIVEVDHVTYPGDSGGALLDGDGDAIAVCDEQFANNLKGRYIPIVSIADIFSQIPVSKRMQKLQSDIVTGNINLDALKTTLTKTSQQQGPSNLELFVWTQSLRSSPEVLAKVAPLVKCPLLHAFNERNIAEAILPLRDRLDGDDANTVQMTIAQREYSIGNNKSAEQLAAASISNPSSSTAGEFVKRRATLLKAAIDDQKTLGGAQTVLQDTQPLYVRLDSGRTDDYYVQWVATIDPLKSETGHPSEPLNGWLTDTRQCKWTIGSQIVRTVFYIDEDGKALKQNSVAAVYSAGFSNEGSDFVFTNFRPENCGDAEAKYQSDLKNARSHIREIFPTVIAADRAKVAADIAKLPHVKRVEASPAGPTGLTMSVY
jgi:hypothetical protein